MILLHIDARFVVASAASAATWLGFSMNVPAVHGLQLPPAAVAMPAGHAVQSAAFVLLCKHNTFQRSRKKIIEIQNSDHNNQAARRKHQPLWRCTSCYGAQYRHLGMSDWQNSMGWPFKANNLKEPWTRRV